MGGCPLKPPTPSPASTPPGSPSPAATESPGTEGQVAVAGGGGEEGFALVEGHEQQVGLAGFVPEDAFAVDPGDVVTQGHLPEREPGDEWEG
jgi:hypothetical protein